ncbi:protoporphyrinogen oxidase [Kwoniella dendrophila CBS 6074]|uniref:Protoporphyrinogen oxidase n=1 Tax=Kwoniella dendrophila CBS 6074 TaxID=1295534 RepID=A0AAX4K2V4_9TREE
MTIPKRITILGGGLSGLTAAYRLSSPSSIISKNKLPSIKPEITLIESSDRIGGWVNSTEHEIEFNHPFTNKHLKGKCLIESGPRSIRPRGSKGALGMLKLLKDLNLQDDIIPIPFSHPSAKNRFILDTENSNKLTKLPSSLLSLLSNTKSPLLKGLLLSIIKEPFKPKPKIKLEDESVDSFFKRRFSESIAKNLGSSMVHGIYAASSKELSLRSTFPILYELENKNGSIIKGMLSSIFTRRKVKKEEEEELEILRELGEFGIESKKWSLFGIKGGLSTITNRLYQECLKNGVQFKSNESVDSLIVKSSSSSSNSSSSASSSTLDKIKENENDDIMQIKTSKGEYESDFIISALSPTNLSKLLLSPEQELPYLDYNPYTSVGVVNLVYPLPSNEIHPDGFGYLIPRPKGGNTNQENPFGILGCIFDSTAIPLKFEKGFEIEGEITKFTLMLGGPYWSSYKPILNPPESKEELIENAIKHLEIIFPKLKTHHHQGIGIKPILKLGKIHWNCIPTYLPNHGKRLNELHTKINQSKWKNKLSLIGNGYGGVGLNDCIYSSQNVIKNLLNGNRNVTGLERWENWE